MIKPRFKVGDVIYEKDFYASGHEEIVAITDELYILRDGSHIRIEEQGEWAVVKHKDPLTRFEQQLQIIMEHYASNQEKYDDWDKFDELVKREAKLLFNLLPHWRKAITETKKPSFSSIIPKEGETQYSLHYKGYSIDLTELFNELPHYEEKI